MPIPSFFKSPAFLTGSGVVGSGAIGIGGWQIYEENFPPMNKTMIMSGFKWDPIVSLNEKKEPEKRVKWSTWGCAKRLFPKVEFKHDFSENDSDKTSYKEEVTGLSPETKPIGCAIMELLPLNEDNKNYFYFRSEFVIKGENVGWVLLVVMASSTKTEEIKNGKTLDAYFLHRLILLKNEESGWKIKEGYGWTGYINTTDTTSLANEKAYIKSPEETWFDGRSMTDTNSVSAKKWSGIWEVSSYYGDSILKGVEAYITSPNRAEVLGSDGTFSLSGSTAGYKNMSALYKDGKGWVKPEKIVGHEKQLPKWYEPFKGLTGGWSELESRCRAASNTRHSRVSEDLKSICWQEQSSK